VDPLANKYPGLTVFQYASNRPIDGVDLDGLEHADVVGVDPASKTLEVIIRKYLVVVTTGEGFDPGAARMQTTEFQDEWRSLTSGTFAVGIGELENEEPFGFLPIVANELQGRGIEIDRDWTLNVSFDAQVIYYPSTTLDAAQSLKDYDPWLYDVVRFPIAGRDQAGLVPWNAVAITAHHPDRHLWEYQAGEALFVAFSSRYYKESSMATPQAMAKTLLHEGLGHTAGLWHDPWDAKPDSYDPRGLMSATNPQIIRSDVIEILNRHPAIDVLPLFPHPMLAPPRLPAP